MFALTSGLILGDGMWSFAWIPLGMAWGFGIIFFVYALCKSMDWISRKIGED